ncbi:MAG: hypothetical protein ACT4OU_08845 [Hyphomicrobium sp.]
MKEPPIRSPLRLPDDVFRARLAETVQAMEQWADEMRDAADIAIREAATFWKIDAAPFAPGACRFETLFNANQTYSLVVAGETYENRPFDRFEFFPMLARAVAAGRVERIETLSALTAAVEMIETRIELEDGWAWIGERRVGPRVGRRLEVAEERRVRRFLPYRR